MKRILRTLLPGLLLCLGGCMNIGTGTSPSRHYLIPSLADQASPLPALPIDAKGLSLAPLTLAGYLDRPQLVRRNGEQLELEPFDRWGEPLADNLGRVLKENLVRLLKRLRLQTFGGDYRLNVDLQRLEGQGDEALLQMRWQLQRTTDDAFLAEGLFRQSRPVADQSAASLVAAYGELLEKFSRELASRLDTLDARY